MEEPDDVAYLRRALRKPIPDPATRLKPYDDARDGELLRRVMRSPTAHAAHSVARRRHVTGRRMLIGAVGVAALLIALGYPTVVGSSAVATSPAMLRFEGARPQDLVTGAVPSASSTLHRIAAAIDSEVSTGGDVQYVQSYNWYLAEEIGQHSTSRDILPTMQQTWLAGDGSFRSREVRTGGFSPSGSLTAPQVALPDGLTEAGDDLPAGTFDAAAAGRLPAIPDLLRDALLSRVAGMDCTGGLATLCIGSAVEELFAIYVVPAEQRAAIWSLLAEDEQVYSLGSVVDRAGRDGIGVAYESGREQDARVHVLIIDPATGGLLGTEDVVVGTPGVEPTVTQVRIFLRSAWVDRLGSSPGIRSATVQ